MNFSTISAVVMDMDGVLWRGDIPLPGMVEMFQWLAESQIPFALATNNSGKTLADYVEKFRRLGVKTVEEHNIVTSAVTTATYMQSRYPAGTPVFVAGMPGLSRTMEDAGFDTSDEEPAQVVVAGIDFGITYEKLKKATLYIRNHGADFIGTNPDITFPTPEGEAPGAGTIIGAIEIASRKEAVIMGKPNLPMFETALEIAGTPPENTLMIGDRLSTDIEGGKNAGMKTALVFSGVTTPGELTDSGMWPDVAYEGLPEIIKAWAGDDWYREKMKAKRQN